VKILRTYLREGMFERNIEWDAGVNLVYSTKNTCGKTSPDECAGCAFEIEIASDHGKTGKITRKAFE